MGKVSNWVFRGKEFTEEMIPEGAVGFVYKMSIPDSNGEPLFYYIGKKNFFADVKTKLGKKELPTDKRLKTYKRVKKTTYKNYVSSNETIKDHVKNGGSLTRVILKVCFSKTELTYYEAKYLFCMNAIEDPMYLNSNILGKFYRKKNE